MTLPDGLWLTMSRGRSGDASCKGYMLFVCSAIDLVWFARLAYPSMPQEVTQQRKADSHEEARNDDTGSPRLLIYSLGRRACGQ